MTALHDFIRAAASYYGVPPERLTEGCTLDASRGDLEVVLRIALTPDDMTGIAGRMRQMAIEREVDEAQAAQAAGTAEAYVPLSPGMRAQYNALSPAVRSQFGSFHRFCALGGVLPATGPRPGQTHAEWVDEVREAEGLPALGDLVGKVELPPHVYLSHSEATEQQKAMAVGRDARGWFAVDPADLTEQQQQRAVHGAQWLPSWMVPDEQRAGAVEEKYVQNTEGGPAAGVRWFRIKQSDLSEQQRAFSSGVTSDAPDFGGLPG